MLVAARGGKKITISRHTFLLAVFLLVVATLPAGTRRHEPVPFGRSTMIIEVNATDGDAGIQISVDADGWEILRVFDPEERKVFEVRGSGSVREQGITELFIESAEPSFDEVPLDEFLDRFPEGEYSFTGRTTEGERLRGKAQFTHNIPAAPVIVFPANNAVLPANLQVVIDWQPVTGPFPGGNSAVTVIGYQVIVDLEGSEPLRRFTVNLPASITHLTVSPEFIRPRSEYKFEVLAIEVGGNQTITESRFRTQ